MHILSTTVSSARGAMWARVLPFGIYMAFIVLADLLVRVGVTDLQLRWLYAAKIAAVLLALWCARRHYTELAWQGMSVGWWALSVGAGGLVWCLWIALDASWMVVGVPGGFNPTDEGRLNWALIVVRLAGAALVVPVMEELFWRSFLLRWLVAPQFLAVAPARATLQAFVIAAVLFGVEHSQWLAGIVAGAVYAGLYMRSQNLWTAIVAHAVTNAVLGVWIIATKSWAYW